MALTTQQRQEHRRVAPMAPPLAARDGSPASVVHLVAELAPYARTGGMGEAVASLAKYQAARGIDTTIIVPLYREVAQKRPGLRQVGDPFTVGVGGRWEEARLFEESPAPSGDGAETQTVTPGARSPRVLFVANCHYFDRGGIYGEGGHDYGDNLRRYGFFCMAALAALPRVARSPLVLHSHDWHTALAPIYLRTYFQSHDFYQGVRTVLTVHNAAFQGHWSADG